MLRLALALVCLVVAAPAMAEDWWHIGTVGDAPTRQTGMFDSDSVDWTDPAIPRFKLALLSETPDEFESASSIATVALDCDGVAATNVYMEVFNQAGELLDAGPLEGSFEAIAPDTFYDSIRLAVCEEQWQWEDGFQFGKGKGLAQIRREVFGS